MNALTPVENGFFIGRIQVGAEQRGLILPPKTVREHAPIAWNKSLKSIEGALSYYDGYANTLAMAKAGSKLAQWALDNKMHIPSQDELEMIYRVAKPGTDKNYCWARSGINLSAVPPTYPYTPDFPLQTTAEAFREGGPEAFESDGYWTSTQRADGSSFAWVQYFDYGSQSIYRKSNKFRACAVRSIEI